MIWLAWRMRRQALGVAAALGLVVAGGPPVRPAAAEDAAPLRLCVDPDNLPFSSSNEATPGFYVELGRAIAQALDRPFQPVWIPTYYTKRQVRQKMLGGQCDGFAGVPEDADFMGPRLIFSQPVAHLGYVLVAPPALGIATVDDLHGRRVAVEYSSPPQDLVAARNDVQAVTVLSPQEAIQALGDGKADAAFTWGPTAGWLNASALQGAYRIVPVEGDHMQWSAGIAFPHDATGLRDAVDRAIAELGPSIQALEAKYGFPATGPVQPVASRPAAPQATEAAPAAAQNAGDIVAGQKLFNENCSHCHGPNAVQGEQRRNLRLLRQRYGDNMPNTFIQTVTHGRVSKGMPNWSGIISTEEFQKILAFLTSVQEPGS